MKLNRTKFLIALCSLLVLSVGYVFCPTVDRLVTGYTTESHLKAEEKAAEKAMKKDPAIVSIGQFASPEENIKEFAAAIKAKDKTAFLKCIRGDRQEIYQDIFDSMDSNQLQQMADDFSNINSPSEISGTLAEIPVIIERNGKYYEIRVVFIKDGDSWLIQSL